MTAEVSVDGHSYRVIAGGAYLARTAGRKAFVILDGTLLPIDRIAAGRPYYWGKHKHGMNVQVGRAAGVFSRQPQTEAEHRF